MKQIYIYVLCVCLFGSMLSGCSKQAMDNPGVVEYEATIEPGQMMDGSMAQDNGESKSTDATESTMKSGITPPMEKGGFGPNMAEKLIHSGRLTLETLDLDKTLKDILDKVAQLGGFTESSETHNDGGYNVNGSVRPGRRSVVYRFRVPKDSFQAFFDQAGAFGIVTGGQSSVENITAQYHDSNMRMASLTVQHERLLEMVKTAEKLEDMLAIESKLADLRWEIDSLQSQLKNWDTDVNYSTVTMEVREVKAYTPQQDDGFFTGIGQTIKESWVRFGRSTADVLRGLIMLFPFALTGVVLWLVLKNPLKRLGKKKKHKQEDGSQENKEQSE